MGPSPYRAPTVDEDPGAAPQYRVHVGTVPGTGRNRWRYFASLYQARQFCNEVARQTREILSIEEC